MTPARTAVAAAIVLLVGEEAVVQNSCMNSSAAQFLERGFSSEATNAAGVGTELDSALARSPAAVGGVSSDELQARFAERSAVVGTVPDQATDIGN